MKFRNSLKRIRNKLTGKYEPEWMVSEIRSGYLTGLKLLTDRNYPEFGEVFLLGDYERSFHHFLVSNSPEKSCILWDVGAYNGYHSLLGVKYLPPGSFVIAFEPDPYNYQLLGKNITLNPSVSHSIICEPFALSAQSEQKKMFCSRYKHNISTSGSYFSDIEPPLEPKFYKHFEQTDVEAISADDYLTLFPDRIPNLIKIDVEGAELLVLEGATKLLTDHKPILFIEVHSVKNHRLLIELLESKNYRHENYNEKDKLFLVAFNTDTGLQSGAINTKLGN
jgi:FkbM family methyltransferase